MKVSIIVPIYKVEKEIERCLRSVYEQDYQNIEIVLVNDYTPDRSYDIARNYILSKNLTKKTVFIEHIENKGLSCARNSGVQGANGDYIFFLDSDDALTAPNVITHLVSYIERDPSLDMVMGNYQKIDDRGVFEVAHESRRFFENNDEIYQAYSKRRLWITAWGKLVRKKTLVDNDLFFQSGIYHEDELWSFRLFRAISKLYVTPTIVYDYHDRQGSIMSQIVEKNIDDWIIILKEMVSIFNQAPTYHKKDTVILIERYRRELLEKVVSFSDKSFQLKSLEEIKRIRVPVVWKKTSIKQQGFLLKLPVACINFYLRFKWGNR